MEFTNIVLFVKNIAFVFDWLIISLLCLSQMSIASIELEANEIVVLSAKIKISQFSSS